MKKVIINECYGGFSLSNEAMEMYLTRKGKVPFYYSDRFGIRTYASKPYVNDTSFDEYYSAWDIDRDDSDLIFVIEALGASASGHAAKLKIVHIPDDADWEIHDYDGMESVREKSRSWS